MKKHLNNDQLIKKANKNVRELGQVASTILTIEIQSLVARRIAELSNGAENINIFHPKQIKDVLKTYLQTFKTEAAVVNVFSKEEDEKQFSCESCDEITSVKDTEYGTVCKDCEEGLYILDPSTNTI